MRDFINDVVTFSVTMSAAVGAYVAGHYDKIAATALSIAGLAFLFWRWRKSAKTQLCDKRGCPYRHDPSEQ